MSTVTKPVVEEPQPSWAMKTVQRVDISEVQSIDLHCTALELDDNDRGLVAMLLTDLNENASDNPSELIAGWASEVVGLVGLGSFSVVGNGERDDQFYNNIRVLRSSAGNLVGTLRVPDRRENLELLLEATANLPLPQFGSRPKALLTVTQMAALPGLSVVMTGRLESQQTEVMTIISAAGAFVIWFGRPYARIARRSLAERFAKSMHTELRDDDLA